MKNTMKSSSTQIILRGAAVIWLFMMAIAIPFMLKCGFDVIVTFIPLSILVSFSASFMAVNAGQIFKKLDDFLS